jgi:hypothetical protein
VPKNHDRDLDTTAHWQAMFEFFLRGIEAREKVELSVMKQRDPRGADADGVIASASVATNTSSAGSKRKRDV